MTKKLQTSSANQPSPSSTTSMNFVGIDVSKKMLDIYLHPTGKYVRFPNTPAGHRDFMASLDVTPDLMVLEASGGYERILLETLQNKNYSVARVQPARVHHFIRSHGISCKTDKLDAKALALFAVAGLAKPTPQIAEHKLVLRDKLRVLSVIKKQKVTLVNHIEKLANPKGDKCLASLVKLTERSIKQAEKDMKAYLEKYADLKKLVECLETMPGVGWLTAVTLVAEMPELGTCTKAQIAALTGVAPMTRQSGQWVGKSSITGGRHLVRKALYMAALTATRANTTLKAIYDAKRSAGKPFKVAIVIIMRHMITTLNAMAKTQSDWSDNLKKTQKTS